MFQDERYFYEDVEIEPKKSEKELETAMPLPEPQDPDSATLYQGVELYDVVSVNIFVYFKEDNNNNNKQLYLQDYG